MLLLGPLSLPYHSAFFLVAILPLLTLSSPLLSPSPQTPRTHSPYIKRTVDVSARLNPVRALTDPICLAVFAGTQILPTDCDLAIDWLTPFDVSPVEAARNIRFGMNTNAGYPEVDLGLDVVLPVEKTAGTCTIKVSLQSFISASSPLFEQPVDLTSWNAIKAAARELNLECVGHYGVGGLKLAGADNGLILLLYGEDSEPHTWSDTLPLSTPSEPPPSTSSSSIPDLDDIYGTRSSMSGESWKFEDGNDDIFDFEDLYDEIYPFGNGRASNGKWLNSGCEGGAQARYCRGQADCCGGFRCGFAEVGSGIGGWLFGVGGRAGGALVAGAGSGKVGFCGVGEL
ncbi:MAG: hypothetical protein M1827_002183 [Pycnora praestabilis]|nr:MAG: hypothetical protein M1827_002183 [Pycnora praestabilis]